MAERQRITGRSAGRRSVPASVAEVTAGLLELLESLEKRLLFRAAIEVATESTTVVRIRSQHLPGISGEVIVDAELGGGSSIRWRTEVGLGGAVYAAAFAPFGFMLLVSGAMPIILGVFAWSLFCVVAISTALAWFERRLDGDAEILQREMMSWSSASTPTEESPLDQVERAAEQSGED